MPKIDTKDVKALAGVLPYVLAPGPTALVNIASKALTGKTVAQNAAGAIRGQGIPAPNTTTSGTKKKKEKDPVGMSYDPAQLGQKNMRVGRYSKGGVVSYKSIADMESKGGR